jgi:hypothetical protein
MKPIECYYKINEITGCWESKLYIKPDGYSVVRVLQRKKNLHKYVYESLRGRVPKGLELDHLCKVRHCCNPDHMEVVTPAVNTRRAIAKITDEQVEEIRRLAGTMYQRNIGLKFGINQSMVSKIILKQSWR